MTSVSALCTSSLSSSSSSSSSSSFSSSSSSSSSSSFSSSSSSFTTYDFSTSSRTFPFFDSLNPEAKVFTFPHFQVSSSSMTSSSSYSSNRRLNHLFPSSFSASSFTANPSIAVEFSNRLSGYSSGFPSSSSSLLSTSNVLLSTISGSSCTTPFPPSNPLNISNRNKSRRDISPSVFPPPPLPLPPPTLLLPPSSDFQGSTSLPIGTSASTTNYENDAEISRRSTSMHSQLQKGRNDNSSGGGGQRRRDEGGGGCGWGGRGGGLGMSSSSSSSSSSSYCGAELVRCELQWTATRSKDLITPVEGCELHPVVILKDKNGQLFDDDEVNDLNPVGKTVSMWYRWLRGPPRAVCFFHPHYSASLQCTVTLRCFCGYDCFIRGHRQLHTFYITQGGVQIPPHPNSNTYGVPCRSFNFMDFDANRDFDNQHYSLLRQAGLLTSPDEEEWSIISTKRNYTPTRDDLGRQLRMETLLVDWTSSVGTSSSSSSSEKKNIMIDARGRITPPQNSLGGTSAAEEEDTEEGGKGKEKKIIKEEEEEERENTEEEAKIRRETKNSPYLLRLSNAMKMMKDNSFFELNLKQQNNSNNSNSKSKNTTTLDNNNSQSTSSRSSAREEVLAALAATSCFPSVVTSTGLAINAPQKGCSSSGSFSLHTTPTTSLLNSTVRSSTTCSIDGGSSTITTTTTASLNSDRSECCCTNSRVATTSNSSNSSNSNNSNSNNSNSSNSSNTSGTTTIAASPISSSLATEVWASYFAEAGAHCFRSVSTACCVPSPNFSPLTTVTTTDVSYSRASELLGMMGKEGRESCMENNNSSGRGSGILVMTWNVLAELYATQEAFPHCDAYILAWPYRRSRILEEILSGGADVVCLQEVQSEHFEDFFRPALSNFGYEGIYKQKTKEIFTSGSGKRRGGKYTMDGCATFYKKDKFRVVENYALEFSNLIKEASNRTLPPEIHRNPAVVKRLLKDNVALVLLLENMESSSYPNSNSSNKCTTTRWGSAVKRQVVIANTHIVANPEANDVKIWQAQALVGVLENYMNEFCRRFAISPSLIICGDFNSTPESAVYQLISSGVCDRNHEDLTTDRDGLLADLHLGHSLSLKSAYAVCKLLSENIPPDECLSMGMLEPLFTNYTCSYAGCLDYMFFSDDTLALCSTRDLIDESHLQQESQALQLSDWSLPSPLRPSDHLPLMAEFVWI